MVLRPGSTAEVAAILKLASETSTAIVPQSGNTGLVGGQIPHESGHEVVLSLERLTAIAHRSVDYSLTVAEAGVTLDAVQDGRGRTWPAVSAVAGLGRQCRIGGNLGSNAGGVNVIAYGNARDLCLGIEAVLADGRVLNRLRALRKDNSGYDLRNCSSEWKARSA